MERGERECERGREGMLTFFPKSAVVIANVCPREGMSLGYPGDLRTLVHPTNGKTSRTYVTTPSQYRIRREKKLA